MKMKLATQIILAFTVVILLSVIDSYTNYLLSLKVETNSKFLSKSEAIIRNSNQLHKSIIEMQGAFRGFLLTDDTTFLENYHMALTTVPGLYKEQRELINLNKDQVDILDSIFMIHNLWLQYADQIINARKSVILKLSPEKEYLDLFENKLKRQVGKKLNDRIKVKFEEFDRSEYFFRNLHAETLKNSIANTHTRSFIFLSLTIITGVISVIYIVMLITKRIRNMVNLAGEIAQGDFRTIHDTRNDELTSLSKSLNIMSDNLGKSMKNLENRNVELNKFAYVVSHDLKAPVRGIRNVVKWLEEDYGASLTPGMKEFLDIIPERTQRMEDLINGLLNYATISNKTSTEIIHTQSLVEGITQYIVPRNMIVEVKDLPDVVGEKMKLEQVFTNLISNAAKYTQNDTGIISISCKEDDKYYTFSVKDNGIGIDPQFHEKIFDLFQTLRKGNEKESTGIGLAIVRKIIEEQGGQISVISTLGQGAEFLFTWPKIKSTK